MKGDRLSVPDIRKRSRFPTFLVYQPGLRDSFVLGRVNRILPSDLPGSQAKLQKGLRVQVLLLHRLPDRVQLSEDRGRMGFFRHGLYLTEQRTASVRISLTEQSEFH